MLGLSQTTGYAVLALSCLRQRGSERMLAKDISECTGIPLPYLLKLMHAMGKADLVIAKRGYQGGFALARPAEKITLMDVAEAVDGKVWLHKCLLGLEDCSDQRACPMHEFWKVERVRIADKLKQLTVRDIAEFEAQRGNRLAGCGREAKI